MSRFEPFYYDKDFLYTDGWDKYALKYADLLVNGGLYYLHKQVMYDYIDEKILPFVSNAPEVLDVNCGTGNDFPYWLLNSGSLTGIDGSKGMLNKAAEIYSKEINEGRLNLFHGMLQDLEPGSLDNRKFDIIYSITGGFSYINDAEMEQSFAMLKQMLKPGGYLITAHLNTFCLPESIYFMLKGNFKRALLRLKKTIPLEDGTFFYLRNKTNLKRILSPHFNSIEFFPLICVAPPYQTDLIFSNKTADIFRKIENRMVRWNIGKRWADQVVCVCRLPV